MAEFTITLKFDSEQISEQEANEKLEAFFKMASVLGHDELIVTAEFIEGNPKAIEQIKEWVTNPPPILRMAHNMLFKH